MPIAARASKQLILVSSTPPLLPPQKLNQTAPPPQKGLKPVPELIRSAVSRARMFFKDRRRSPRLQVRLNFSLSVIRQTKLKRLNGSDRALKGHTRDISASGLALLLPQIQLDGYHLASEDREMKVDLELSGGVISMVVVPNRYEKLERAELGCNYLIGARIVRIDEEDKVRYQDFMRRLLEHGRQNDEAEVQLKTSQPNACGT